MSIPTNPADKNWPKGPNFKAIVIAFAITILVLLLAAFVLLSGRGRSLFKVNTHSTPSQTALPRTAPGTPS